MSGFSLARSTESTSESRGRKDAPSTAAWERVTDRVRKKLPDSPSRSDLFGQAGLRHSKMYWMRRQPDLRMSVIVALASALELEPSSFFEMILREEKKSPSEIPDRGEIRS